MISGKTLKKYGWKQGRALGLARAAAAALADQDTGLDRETILNRLDAVRANSTPYLEDPIMAPLATKLDRTAQEAAERAEVPRLRAAPLAFGAWVRREPAGGAFNEIRTPGTLRI